MGGAAAAGRVGGRLECCSGTCMSTLCTHNMAYDMPMGSQFISRRYLTAREGQSSLLTALPSTSKRAAASTEARTKLPTTACTDMAGAVGQCDRRGDDLVDDDSFQDEKKLKDLSPVRNIKQLNKPVKRVQLTIETQEGGS